MHIGLRSLRGFRCHRGRILRLSVCVFVVASVGFAVYEIHAQNSLPDPVSRNVSYMNDIHPILAERCYKCHAGGKRKGGFQLDTRSHLLDGSENGPVVKPGNSAESRLVHVVAGLDPETVMPPEGERLTTEQVALLRAWIDQGLPWDGVEEQAEPKRTPLALRSVSPPDEPASYPNPVDRFIFAYFAEHNLPRPERVSDGVFLRRVYLDLCGLLPSPEQTQSFLADTDPHKRDKIVETLLADSRAYAEHWISFWNDLLRNDFEGTGYIDGGRKHITEWLFQALYENMPYDAFVRELIAPTSEKSEGFIRGIVWRGDSAVVQQPPMQAAQNVAQVFLGINLKCASCHDSFIDHWRLRDAFGLANCFSDKNLEMVRCDTPQGKMAPIKFLWEELGTIDPAAPQPQRAQRVAELTTSPANGYFARTIVNRLWARLMGWGLIEPLDKIENESWHPELLDWLAQDFIEHGYDVKHTLRRIVMSETYQLPAVLEAPNPKHYVFRGPLPKRLTAEQFYDAISCMTGVWQKNPKFEIPGGVPTDDRVGVRAWRISADALTRALGRPNREQVTTRREEQPTTLQALELQNGTLLHEFLREGAKNLLATVPQDAQAVIETIFQRGIQRSPLPEELTLARELLGTTPTEENLTDFLWIIAMHPEFQYVY